MAEGRPLAIKTPKKLQFDRSKHYHAFTASCDYSLFDTDPEQGTVAIIIQPKGGVGTVKMSETILTMFKNESGALQNIS